MAKKSSTIHVEEFVWDEIEAIQNKNDISSRNSAIEYLVAEYRGLRSKLDINTKQVENKDVQVKKELVEVKEKDIMSDKLRDMENDMPN